MIFLLIILLTLFDLRDLLQFIATLIHSYFRENLFSTIAATGNGITLQVANIICFSFSFSKYIIEIPDILLGECFSIIKECDPHVLVGVIS
jgi:hypothetical protein